MKYCSACGAPVELRTPCDDNRARHICTACGIIHYQNPRLVIASIPAWKDKVLLCRRAIEPRYGLWTLPGGFMENGESTGDAAIRETLEEACARIEIIDLFSMYSLPYLDQVHLLFRARLLDLDFAPGQESLEVRLFSEAQIPWDELAFRPVRYSLEHYFSDRNKGAFSLHTGELAPPVSLLAQTGSAAI
ncbi:MAG: NUDIX hydrolase [Gallionella sp.]|jgi:ADP-ribose pyrophosphatase YjhB (NUDIX family)